jgi:hypothetical protein
MCISPTRIWTFDYQNRADPNKIRRFLGIFPDPAGGSVRRIGNALILGPSVTGHDLGTSDLLNHQAVSSHQPQCRFELGDPADRDQVAPSRAILPQSGIQNGARRS